MIMLHSPLRYPGGKACLAPFIEETLRENLLNGGNIVEPYAGGAGLSLSLLSTNAITKVYLVEKDPLIYSFWKSVTTQHEELCDRIWGLKVNLDTWKEFQKYKAANAKQLFTPVELGLAGLFLNRTNFSGIIDAKPIGGMGQKSDYKIDCRFNKDRIIASIENIASVGSRINVAHSDALTYLRKNERRILNDKKSLVYIDPPYLGQGRKLYRYAYGWSEHEKLAAFIERQKYPWVISIDSDPRIKELYSKQKVTPIFLKYAVKKSRKAEELIITNLRHLPATMSGNESLVRTTAPAKKRASGC